MNWGKGIVLGLGAFMLFVLALVVAMIKSPDDSYDKDYYEKGLTYDIEMEQKQNVYKDEAKPMVELMDEMLKVKFSALDSGKVTLYRPSDNKLDKSFAVADSDIEITTKDLAKGEWKMIAKWYSKGTSYLYEQNIFVQ
ncbi:FixH family protein [Pseudopedobacter beijingensis]|uniref:FixH family protein n=1 Tax=Pseudopedobacter beijingensis TaxID=1207056 RepID=A0ABW4IAE3_9SPHI